MFKIRGADGREYGPVDAGQMRQWISEGRAGGLTQVQAVGTTQWVLLNSVPEFADIFKTPPPVHSGVSGAMPPIVQTLAFGFFIVAGVSALWQVVGLVTLFRYVNSGNFHPGIAYFLGWILGIVSLPLRIVCGLGLLRGREWARRLAVIAAIVLALYGIWELVQTGIMISRVTDSTFMLRSPSFLLSHLWSLAVFAFNIATAVILSRKDVRAAFAQKTSSAA